MFDHLVDADAYQAIIDIGSNSVRLVVFSGEQRVPDTIFNEKILAGLGAKVGETGKMDRGAMKMAISTLKRFRALCRQMQVTNICVVATAAVRDAKNGAKFVARVKKECGLDIQVIDGLEEARLAGLGVLSGEPAALGVAGDLGGGSLELARIKDGDVYETISLPIGPLRLMSRFGRDRSKIKKFLREAFAAVPWLAECDGESLYMVGGAWRNIVKLMMRERSNPLPILHGHSSSRGEISAYCRRVSKLDINDIPFGGSLPSRRREVLPTAAIILMELLSAMHAKRAVTSSYGLREGLLFDALGAEKRKIDPFLYSCQILSAERCRFAEHARVIFEWTRPLFQRKSMDPKLRDRLQYAVCLLGDIAWRGHPDFRAEKAVESALHGNFVGVNHRDRAYVAVALNQAYGAPIDTPHLAPMLPLLKIDHIMEARMMGAALRLAQRLSGGTVKALEVSELRLTKNTLYLGIPSEYRDIANDVVLRRVRQLAQLIGRKPKIEYLAEAAD
jgi:exopolyphosphatase / guanosine-5'-triphosphate,3'-diphosphate pyrophosphatase